MSRSVGETSLCMEATKGDFEEEVAYELSLQIRVQFNMDLVRGKGTIQVYRSRKASQCMRGMRFSLHFQIFLLNVLFHSLVNT